MPTQLLQGNQAAAFWASLFSTAILPYGERIKRLCATGGVVVAVADGFGGREAGFLESVRAPTGRGRRMLVSC